MKTRVVAVLILAVFSACDDDEPEELLSREALMDPESCKSCHPNQYREWSGSMHAYAAEDPVFIAMNARGQRETGGALGDFCVKCHAPMAVQLGATRDGMNLQQLPKSMRGVTCYFCHSTKTVEGTHNNPLRLADDGIMRGGIADPVRNKAHKSAYSPLLDRERLDSSSTCGSCHDLVNQAGVHLERTFAEWKGSIFAQDVAGLRLTCGGCHMTGRDGLAAEAPGVLVRRVHDHSMPGVDVALTPFPEAEAQRAAVQRELDTTILATLCVQPREVTVTLDNVGVGHGWPSGANQDRRAWVEVVAYQGSERIFESGVVADDAPVETLADPNLLLLRDRIFDDLGKEVHMFWQARRVESAQARAAVTLDPMDPRYREHVVTKVYPLPAAAADRITMRVRIRPMALTMLDELIQSGDLDPSVRAKMPTFTLGTTVIEWKRDHGFGCFPR